MTGLRNFRIRPATTLVSACTLTALLPLVAPDEGSGKTQAGQQTPQAAQHTASSPLAIYDHCDVEPGVNLDTALNAFRSLKERQADAWGVSDPVIGDPDRDGGILPFQIYPGNPDRWGTPGAYGKPEIITWSLAPDTALYFPTVPNQLFAWMDNEFNGTSNWVWRIEDAFLRWSELTGITFVRVQYQGAEWDDGADYGAPGAEGLRGDIRLFAAAIDGTGGTLAAAEPPAGIPPAPSPGEITFDLETWGSTWWNPQYGFERAIHHEIGHAIGLDHTCPAQSNTKLMQPFASTPFGTPQHDDARGAQALYGDPLEPNDTREQAEFFQVFPPGHPIPRVPAYWPSPDSIVFPGGVLSIDNGNDSDWFEFGLLAGASMNVTVRPVGGQYQDYPVDPATLQCPGTGGWVNSATVTPLIVQLWRSIDANDDVLVAQTSGAAGSILQLNNVLLKYPGRYRIHVKGNSAFVPKISQQYELEVMWDAFPCSGGPYCDDGVAQNGTEVCDPQGGCLFEYIDDDYNFNSIPDSMEPWLGDCDGNGRVDVGETAYLSSGNPRALVRGQDECGDAQPIASGIDYEYMTYYASPDPGIWADSSGVAGVWFSYTPQTNGVFDVQVRSHLDFPTELYVSPLTSTGGCNSSSSIFTASQIDWSPIGQPIGQLAQLTFEGQANVEHRIRVSGHWSIYYLDVGDFTVRVDGPDDVTNDCDKNGVLDVCQSGLDCNGNGIIDSCELVGATNHCLLSENVAGPGSIISAAGTLSVSANNLTLIAEGAAPNANGVFVASTSRLPMPEEGKICLAGPVIRMGTVQTAADGTAVFPLDFTQYPQMAAGTTWNYQFWFRDNGGPGIGYVGANVSDAIELTFCP